MKKGISVWSLPADWNLEKVFYEANAAGFLGVELALGSSGITMNTTDDELKEIKLLAKLLAVSTFQRHSPLMILMCVKRQKT